MISLTARQTDLAGRATIAPITLIRLTTYSDWEAKTVSETFSWSSVSCVYDYGDTGTEVQFHGILLSLDTPERTMPHVPSPVSTSGRERLQVTLANVEIDGERLWKTLRAENLNRAEVEVASLLVSPTRLGVEHASSWWHFSDLVGDEHLVRYRGELERVGEISEGQITLEFLTPEPRVPWIEALDADLNDPKDFGKRLPVVVGQAKRVPVINYEVGWVTTLAEEITAATTGNVEVTDASGFPTSPDATAQLGAERVTLAKVSDTVVDIKTRGVDSTTASPHKAGLTLVEIPTNGVFVLAGHECDAVDAMYLQSPFTGELIRVTAATGTTALADTTTILGETVCSVTYSAADIKAILDEAAAAAEVTTQPEFESDVVVEMFELSTRAQSTGSTLPAGGSDSESRGNPNVAEPGVAISTTNNEFLEFYIPSGSIPNNTRSIVRYRIRFEGDAETQNANNTRIIVDYSFAGEIGAKVQIYSPATSSDEYGIKAVDAWKTPSSKTLADLEGGAVNTNPRCRVWMERSTGEFAGHQLRFIRMFIEAELEPTITRTQDVAIAAASLGAGLRFFADVDGAPVPSATAASYDGAAGTLIEEPNECLRWFIADFCGLGQTAIDSTTFDEADTNLGSNLMAGNLAAVGTTFREVTQRMAFETRANLVREEGASGSVWKLHTATSTYQFGTADKTVTEWSAITEETRATAELANRFRAFYALDASVGDSEDAFGGVVQHDSGTSDSGNPSTTEMGNAEDRFGVKDSEPLFLKLVQQEATAEDVAGYFAHEGIRDGARVLRVTLPHWEGYDLERGDVIELVPPWDTSTVKLRVIAVLHQLSGPEVTVAAVEVE